MLALQSKSVNNNKPQSKGKSKGAVDVADAVLKSFNTWAYKREQPSDMGYLSQVVREAVQGNGPVEFVLYWGKGRRVELDEPDTTCLDYLASMADRIRQVFSPGATIRLIFTDTHATLNGHAPDAMNSYFDAVEAAARPRGFLTARLTDVVATARATHDIEAGEVPSAAVLRNLVTCAAKWYRGENSTEEGALEYFRMNMVEKRAMETVYPQAVFITFNGGEFRDLFPARMPIFYMYSLKRGFGVKPWFMASDGQAALA